MCKNLTKDVCALLSSYEQPCMLGMYRALHAGYAQPCMMGNLVIFSQDFSGLLKYLQKVAADMWSVLVVHNFMATFRRGVDNTIYEGLGAVSKISPLKM